MNTNVNQRTNQETLLLVAISSLDRWFDTMRGPEGYGGPVAHWWQNCLQFTGAGLDWRYEGIIIGYLNLYKKTGDAKWLEKACRAGEDLINGQLPSGNYRNSSFELNPYPGGTPHEAACDLALLHLAAVLNQKEKASGDRFLASARRNIYEYYIAKLWDPRANCFRDSTTLTWFVPNKAASVAEAILTLAQLTGDDELVAVYALPTLDSILDHQVSSGRMDGAIYQNSNSGRMVPKFFPYYIAHCILALVAGYELVQNDRYLDAAYRAMAFVLNWQYDDGSFPQVVYENGRINRFPQWIAAVGVILRAMNLLVPYGIRSDPEPAQSWMLAGQEASGGIRTAHGFASQISQRRPGHLPEFRDLLPVVGWNDRAFRYLTDILPINSSFPIAEAIDLPGFRDEIQPVLLECTSRGIEMEYREDANIIELRQSNRPHYRWIKGEKWAAICAPALMVK